MKKIITTFGLILCCASTGLAKNTSNDSFSLAKRMLEHHVYIEEDMRTTIYCNIAYTVDKVTLLTPDFKIENNRAKRVEWEHVVPAENFGRTFSEWRNGHSLCINKKNKTFKGRKCAEKVNKDYRYMQADMYNLYPAVGSVNEMRANYNFIPMRGRENFGKGCPDMIIQDRKASPPPHARGEIARAYLYMDSVYFRFNMSNSQRKLMHTWNRQHPVTESECVRTKRIEFLQKNENQVVKALCQQNGFW